MTKDKIERWALVAAGVVIVALTGAAFWLSYAHLAEVAGAHGLGHAPERQWAWPATLDAFIVAGELLMLRAGLRGRTDWWAVGLTASGSLGSIGLNVAGVGANAVALDYVVAAVPPTAALLAFGALMRQVHGLVADQGTPTPPMVDIARVTPAEVAEEVTLPARPELSPAAGKELVICGGREVFTLALPARKVDREADAKTGRLPADEAMNRIRAAWVMGKSVTEAAEMSTRSRSYVHKVYARLDAERGPQPISGQTELELAAA